MLVACIGLYGERVDQATPGIERLIPYVDRYVVIADETVNDEQRNMLTRLGCEVHVHPWEDSMVKMRNQYLSKVGDNDWVIVHDPDEHFNEDFCKDVRKIIEDAESNQVTLLLINSHDINHDEDGETRTCDSDFFKNLIFKKIPGTKYHGVGEIREVHEMLVIPGTKKSERLDRKYWYTHEKHYHEKWERAARNVFIAGGGNNRGTGNKSWRPLRDIFDQINIKTWPQAREYLRNGNIDPRLKEWLWNNRYDGFDYEHEMMEFGRWYFQYLHPEEARFPDGKVWKPEANKPIPESAAYTRTVMSHIEKCYIKVLGRHADEEGKQHYTREVLAGNIKLEDIANILRESEEFRMVAKAKMHEGNINV